MAADAPDLVHIPGSGLDVTRDLHLIYHESRSDDEDLRAVVTWILRHMSTLPNPAEDLRDMQSHVRTISG
jgi:DNA-binding transcriptional LysR family regulator